MRVSKRILWITAVAVAIAVAIVAWLIVTSEPAAARSEQVVVPAPTPELERGRLAYDEFCAECHGANTVGTDKGPAFLHRIYHPGHHGDGAFLLAAKRGARAHHWRFGEMKPVPGLGDAELEAVVGYIRAVQKANGIF